MKYELRPMDVGEILDRSLKVYLANFGLLFSIALVVAIPMMILSVLLIGGLGLEEFDPSSGQPPDPEMLQEYLLTLMTFVFAMVVMSTILSAVTQGALFQAVSDLYLGRPTGMGPAFAKAFSKLVTLLLATFLLSLAYMAGMVACCVGFLFAYAAFGVAIPAVMLEGQGPIDAMTRSWNLTAGHRWRVLGTLLVTFLVIGIWSWIVQFATQAMGLDYMLQNAVGQLAGAAVSPFVAVVTILLYYDLRVRKEAFDLQVLARELGGTGGPV